MLKQAVSNFFKIQVSVAREKAYALYHEGKFGQALLAAEQWRDNSRNSRDCLRAKSLMVSILNKKEQPIPVYSPSPTE